MDQLMGLWDIFLFYLIKSFINKNSESVPQCILPQPPPKGETDPFIYWFFDKSLKTLIEREVKNKKLKIFYFSPPSLPVFLLFHYNHQRTHLFNILLQY